MEKDEEGEKRERQFCVEEKQQENGYDHKLSDITHHEYQ